jgi:DNA polymerase-1
LSKIRPVVLVDAFNLFMRHYVAHPAMSDQGHHVGGIVGFLNGLKKICLEMSPSDVVVVWEGGGSKKRRDILSTYKMSRRPQKLNRFYENDDIPNTIENRNDQITFLISSLKRLPVIQVYVDSCEADDVIGYLSRYKFRDNKKVIISSDRDYYQLLDNETIIYSPTWKKFVNKKEVVEKFGISPNNFCLAKAICGDPSDNIKGVKGAGFKTVSKRFPMLSTDDDCTILDIISEARQRAQEKRAPKIFKEIASSESLIRTNWRLTYLDTSNLAHEQIKKIESSIDTFTPLPNKISVIRMMIKNGIQNLDIDHLFLSMRNIGKRSNDK